ncbi:MAG: nuclear transport factor 2 family protein [Chloroflexi bacterium]|nr:nuclear transport factor 2 family protein [Chloroflexota bacterium]
MSNDRPMVVERLRSALDAHDLDTLVACFAETYRNETPAHPARGFEGRAQVRTNWERIFQAVPDIRAKVIRTAVTSEGVWSEWEMRGNRGDGERYEMRGVIIFGIDHQAISWARFYLEPLDPGNDSVDQALTSVIAEPRDLIGTTS